ncbi:MAG: N-acetylglucosaminyldiphosphoundecaprenol N-acetyl-beta-D-mannosaminyltransferase [Firmicutes bacterium]|nr:N-acetylglucosaminyldiphosphoundecaprenol N-acetyl-beta-D-mannosaminyltransferase [Bacillota bacterium]
MDTGVDVLGFKIAPLTMAQAVERALQLIVLRRGQIVTANAEILYTAVTDESLGRVVQAAELVIADGMGVVWGARFTGQKLPERVSGYDLLHALCQSAGERGLRVYLLGGEPSVAEAAAARLKELYPRLTVAGIHHGYFAETESDALLAAINAAQPDFLFVALGLRGERWIYDRKAVLACPAMQVGGSFDILAGKAVRAPRWMQRSGLEWAYRLFKEPKRLKRIWALPLFMWKVVTRRVTA